MQSFDYSPYLPFIPLVWIGGWILVSILYRKSRNKPIFPRAPSNARFSRRGISGSSHRDLLTRLGGARNCLMVAVTSQGVMITPTFPFNLMFLPEVYDLEHNIRYSDLISVQTRPGLLCTIVEIAFRTRRGFTRRIVLRLRNGEELAAAILKRPGI